MSARAPRPKLATRLAYTFAQVVTTAELRKKLLVTLGLIVLYRFGANLPLPGISEQNVRYCSGLTHTSSSPVAGVFAMLNVLSGNALPHLAVFALGIFPYITASIIIQLLTQVVPRLEKLKKEGQAGQAKITQYTRYLAVGLAILPSATYVGVARSGNLFPGSGCSAANHPLVPHPTAITLVTMMITMVSGAAVVMWLGELITDRGIGNGMSVLIFTSTIAVVFGQMEQIYLPRGAQEITVGHYHAWLIPAGYGRSGEVTLVIEGAAGTGQMRDLVIDSTGLSRTALVSAVSAGLS